MVTAVAGLVQVLSLVPVAAARAARTAGVALVRLTFVSVTVTFIVVQQQSRRK